MPAAQIRRLWKGRVFWLESRKSAGHLAALCGICLYYLLENIALTYTMTSNVGVIISVTPFFTAILSHLFMKSEGKLRANFFIGFVAAMAGDVGFNSGDSSGSREAFPF